MRSFAQKAILLVLIAFLVLPAFARADTLSISPASGSYSVGKTFPVNVYVSSLSQSVNAVSGTISFPADKLEVVSVSKAGSVLTLWVSDPTFSNSAGTISFEGVVPNPGFLGSAGRLITVNFKVIGSGSATVKWSTASELANDGNGTNILKNLNTATYSLGGSAPAPAPAPVAVKPGGILITSSSFPDQKKWYNTDSGKFTWRLTDSVTAVKMLVGKQPSSDPTVLYDPPVEEKEVTNLEDGIWYFHLAAKTASGWGPASHYQFRVDTTPPESFIMKPVESDDATDPTPAFTFSATDSVSGINHYTVQIDDAPAAVWRDTGDGVYTAPALGPGKHSILAKAYDEAGNSTPASLDFTIASIAVPKIDFYTESVKENAPFVVRGSSLPNARVEIRLSKSSLGSFSADDAAALKQSVATDDSGAFSAAFDTGKLASGAYRFSAVTIDSRGAHSEPSADKTVLVNASWIQSIGSSLMKTLAVAVPLVALIYLLALLFIRGTHHVKMTNRKFRSELHDVERMVDKAFVLLKEDVEDSIRLLERTRSRRKLTEEEDAIIDRLRANLRDAEEVIHGQVRKIERDLD